MKTEKTGGMLIQKQDFADWTKGWLDNQFLIGIWVKDRLEGQFISSTNKPNQTQNLCITDPLQFDAEALVPGFFTHRPPVCATHHPVIHLQHCADFRYGQNKQTIFFSFKQQIH